MVSRHSTFPADHGLARWQHLSEMVLLATTVVCALVFVVAALSSQRARIAATAAVAAIEAPTTAPTLRAAARVALAAHTDHLRPNVPL